jgi:hypothetical protein
MGFSKLQYRKSDSDGISAHLQEIQKNQGFALIGWHRPILENHGQKVEKNAKTDAFSFENASVAETRQDLHAAFGRRIPQPPLKIRYAHHALTTLRYRRVSIFQSAVFPRLLHQPFKQGEHIPRKGGNAVLLDSRHALCATAPPVPVASRVQNPR